MRRVLSALVLLPLFLAGIWFLPPLLLFGLALFVLLLAFRELVVLVGRLGARLPTLASVAAAVATCAAFGLPRVPLDLALVAAFLLITIAVVLSREPGPGLLQDVSAALLPLFYLALPLGLMVAIRIDHGREALLLLIVAVVASDTAQYYAGRALGRRKLAPAISPAKTIEGALGGLLVGVVVVTLLGRLWLPALNVLQLAALGAFLVGLGIAGDLFESLLKRSAQVKDSSALIPGHGGILDRIDALLFAAPGYYFVLRLATW
jgi:phosphatidate cytidylyltransferase